MIAKHIDRREFVAAAGSFTAALLLTGCQDETIAQKISENVIDLLRKNAVSDPGIVWCGAREVPDNVASTAKLHNGASGVDLLKISGTVYASDGKTPAPDTLIYLYHTDVHGIYGRSGEPRHGRYRTWLLTDRTGSYSFETIRPASYPDSTIASHIHMTVTTVEQKEDWIDSILFEGDRFISDSERRRAGQKGGFQPIIGLEKNAEGLYFGRRDIKLNAV